MKKAKVIQEPKNSILNYFKPAHTDKELENTSHISCKLKKETGSEVVRKVEKRVDLVKSKVQEDPPCNNSSKKNDFAVKSIQKINVSSSTLKEIETNTISNEEVDYSSFLGKDSDFFIDDLQLGEWEVSALENTPPLTQNSPATKIKSKRKAHDEDINLIRKKSLCSSDKNDLKSPTKCVINKINKNCQTWEIGLSLTCLANDIDYDCKLKGVWFSCPVQMNDVVTVQAVSVEEQWIIDNDHGFLCLYPDVLLSTTSLVGSMYCQRKGLLTEIFRGLESENKYMIIGKLAHEMLQKSLEHNLTSSHQIEQVMKECLNSEESIHSLYSCGLSLKDATSELTMYAKKSKNFIDNYVVNDSPINISRDNFAGKIREIVDIEETVVAPKLGVKGRIDVTVKINKKGKSKLVPLEIKTGRASFSNEHASQVTLYTMMLSELNFDVQSGLLLYLKENEMKEIVPMHLQKRDLICLRNQLIQYVVRDHSKFGVQYLPDAVYKQSCPSCPYVTLCSTFLKCDGLEKLPVNSKMYELCSRTTEHLTQSDISYFLKWSGLICLEKNKKQTNIWSMSVEERLKSGAVFDLTLESVTKLNKEYLHVFTKPNLDCKLLARDYVTVSTKERYSIVSGYVYESSYAHCTVLLNKDLSNRFKSQTFVIDVSFSSTTLNTICLTNLSYLLNNEEHINKLRNIIVEKLDGGFDLKLEKEILNKGMKLLSTLNEQQQRAVLKVFSVKDYCLIQGMPGCGKTQTLVILVKLLVLFNKSVLITSHAHSAVDNVLLRLDIPFLRLGSLNRINKNLHKYCENVLIKDCKTPEDLDKLYKSYSVVGTTCFGATHSLLKKRRFDYCIVDESTQVLQPEVLLPLFYSDKFVLIGDPKQLPPVVTNKDAKSLGMDETLFDRLLNNQSTISLSIQYRMNGCITQLANKLTYNNELQCANDEVASQVLQLNNKINEKWMEKIFSNKMNDSVLFYDTGNVKLEDPCCNKYEVSIIWKIVSILLVNRVNVEDIGVLAPYRAQILLLNKHLSSFNLESSTVDQYQGIDREIIIYSCTKSSVEKIQEFEILNDERRLNVAVTRAKKKLIMIGDISTLKHYQPFAKLIDILLKDQIISVYKNDEDKVDFNLLVQSLE